MTEKCMVSTRTPIILPPFTFETATAKVRAAEDAWNSRDPERVALSYSVDSQWRNRGEFVRGREEIKDLLRRKWNREREYRLVKELWGFLKNRMAVRFQYEWQDDSGDWHREFDDDGLMRRREASINDIAIAESDRKFFWPAPGPRPADHKGITEIK